MGLIIDESARSAGDDRSGINVSIASILDLVSHRALSRMAGTSTRIAALGVLQLGEAFDSFAAKMEAIEHQIRAPALGGLYRYWRDILIDGADLPNLTRFDLGALEDKAFLAEVKADGFYFFAFGESLERRLGYSLKHKFVPNDANELFGSAKAAYRNCVELSAPCYDYARYDLGDGPPLSFERLILPLFSPDKKISHIAGAVIFNE